MQAGGLATGSACLRALDCLAIIEAELRGRNACNVVELTTPLLARGTAPPPEAGDGKDAAKVWLCAVSAVEQALWDVLGKVTNKPVYALLGGSWQGDGYALRLYANINRITRLAEERVPSTFAKNAAAAVAAGHSAIKLGPFDHVQKAAASVGEAMPTAADTGAGGVANWDEVRKRVFLRHFILKTITLPRQARDKRRESSKRDAFSCSTSAVRSTTSPPLTRS